MGAISSIYLQSSEALCDRAAEAVGWFLALAVLVHVDLGKRPQTHAPASLDGSWRIRCDTLNAATQHPSFVGFVSLFWG